MIAFETLIYLLVMEGTAPMWKLRQHAEIDLSHLGPQI